MFAFTSDECNKLFTILAPRCVSNETNAAVAITYGVIVCVK